LQRGSESNRFKTKDFGALTAEKKPVHGPATAFLDVRGCRFRVLALM